MYLMGTLVRPSSTDNWTGMSSTMLMSLTVPSPPPEKGRTGSPDNGPPCSPSPGLSSVRFCSSSASAQPANGSSAPTSLLSSSVDIFFSQPAHVGIAQAFFDTNGVLGIVRSVLALKNGDPTNRCANAGFSVQLDEIARLHGQQLLHGGVGACQFGHQGHFGCLDFPGEHADPAAIHFNGVALGGRIQHVTDRLQRRVGHADVDGARKVPDFQLKRRGYDDFAGGGNVGKLRLHLRPLVLQLQRVNALQGLFVFSTDHVHQAVDDPLLRGRKIPTFNPCLELAHAAVQRTDGHNVEVRGYRQLAQKGAVTLHGYRAYRNFRTAADEIEEPDAEVACKPLVDDFHRRHTPTDDALLAGNVVVAYGSRLRDLLDRLLALTSNPFKKGINFFLGKK